MPPGGQPTVPLIGHADFVSGFCAVSTLLQLLDNNNLIVKRYCVVELWLSLSR